MRRIVGRVFQREGVLMALQCCCRELTQIFLILHFQNLFWVVDHAGLL